MITALLLSDAPLRPVEKWLDASVSVNVPVPALFAAKVSVPLFRVLVPGTLLVPIASDY